MNTDKDMNKPLPRLCVVAPGREFVLPYIKRELNDYEIVTDGDADFVVHITEPGDATPKDGAAVLACANIVGTGMTGFPMEVARRIAAGSYYHIAGNEARLSTLHAVDLARAVALVIGKPGVYFVNDGCNPTYAEFAEALAWRIKQKRILTLKPSWARWLMNGRLRRAITDDTTFDGSAFASDFNFKPNSVTEYLRTHVYDDESL